MRFVTYSLRSKQARTIDTLIVPGGFGVVHALRDKDLVSSAEKGKYPPAKPGALGMGPLKAAGLDPKLHLFATYETFSLKIPIQPAVQLFLRQLENRYRFT